VATSQNKRGSGSSQSTGNSSDSSPNSSSPITPFGSSDSSLGALNGKGHKSQSSESKPGQVKVKVYFRDDIFVVLVPRSAEFADLVEKVGKKIRLCGRQREDGPLRVKYRDEDGDMISLGSTEDVQMAFEQAGEGQQVTLFVQ
jgi:cell division control protein 24